MGGQYAVVTGASRGLGKELVIELARRGISSIMIGTNENVGLACAEINAKYNTQCVSFTANLCQKEEPRDIDSSAHSVPPSVSCGRNGLGKLVHKSRISPANLNTPSKIRR